MYYDFFSRPKLIEDKHNITIINENSGEIIETDQDQGIIQIRTRPNIPVNLKLKVFNASSLESQDYGTMENGKSFKTGVILTSIMTLTNNSGFKLTDDYGMYKPSAEREERVRAGIRISHQKSYGFNIKCFRYTMLKFCNFSDNSYFTWNQFL